ncbi:2Fe-2S iron-sulfur cluster-binding protein [Leptolyngbya sp. FACHB-261]|uniref:2Fe-2S iron-sulfur cluster-binding protein n=1 Tax=Leptolyngbya sp. FACHB-261 TaxID=2692806 RepID=UPI001681E0E3|nr:2Fe-2S iron-sulfur cluster-binding protein [Leptolyngbya sp. FACHB-261]MBD2101237.1 2Fe-2S iron-sulfur cluster binding domain-containing protein [Leptolyngbya sp. FACHB-261]
MAEYQVHLINEDEGLDEIIEVDEDEYILDAAAAAGITLPFSCRAGTCSTCTARVLEGEVDDSDGNPAMFFNSDQRAAGYRLICIGYARGDCKILTHQESTVMRR